MFESKNYKVSMKKTFVAITLTIVTFLLYSLIGSSIPFIGSKAVNEKYQESFNSEAFYSDSISSERASLITTNEEAFEIRVKMIEAAKETLIISAFTYNNDEYGLKTLSLLHEAAKRGVQINLVLDGFTSFIYSSGYEELKAFSTLNNVDVKIYNPINVLTPWKHNGRLHDKYIIVDDSMFLIGGRNINQQSLSPTAKNQKYDLDVFVYDENPNASSSVKELITYSKTVWNSQDLEPLNKKDTSKRAHKHLSKLESIYNSLLLKYSAYFEDIDFSSFTKSINKVSFITNPIHLYNKEPLVFYGLIELMKSANTRVKVHTPYMIMDKHMYEGFNEIGKKDIEATIFTNSIANNDNPFGANELRLSKNKIINTNFDLYEFDGEHTYHSKTILIDDRLSIVGSFNMDNRSTYIDTEIMVVIDGEELNNDLFNLMSEFEKSAIMHNKEGITIPEGFNPQSLSFFDRIRLDLIFIITHWLRFLM